MGFDRIKPPEDRAADPDPAGRGALFSAGGARTSGTGVEVTCSRCGETSRLDAATALRSAMPLFLVAPWREHPLFAVCPAGGHRAWLRVSLTR